MPAPDVDPIPHNDDRNEEIFLKYIGVLFQIDQDGRVWRIAEMRMGIISSCERRRAEYPSKGYLRIRMSINGVRIRVSAHRIVYRHFKGDIPQNSIINHDDLKRSNNHPDNLLPASQSFNVKHGSRWKKSQS
jgi:hypothetical protein